MTEFTRADGRALDQMRSVRITRNFTTNPAGSVLVEFGNTRVMCTASVEYGVLGGKPAFARIALEARHAIFHGCGAHDAGVAELHQDTAGGVGGEVAGDADGAQFVYCASVCALKISHGLQATGGTFN